MVRRHLVKGDAQRGLRTFGHDPVELESNMNAKRIVQRVLFIAVGIALSSPLRDAGSATAAQLDSEGAHWQIAVLTAISLGGIVYLLFALHRAKAASSAPSPGLEAPSSNLGDHEVPDTSVELGWEQDASTSKSRASAESSVRVEEAVVSERGC